MSTRKKKAESKSSGSAGGKRAEEKKLLEEVSTFVVSERKDLETQLQAQKQASSLWKEKYDDLAAKVSKTIEVSGNIRAYDIFDDFKDDGDREPSSSSHDIPVTDMVLSRLQKADHQISTLDLGGHEITVDAFRTITQSIIKLHSLSHLRVFNLSRCNLTDDHADLLHVLLSNNAATGFDLSFNQLGSGFGMKLMDSLTARRSSPNYLLLHGNKSLFSGTMASKIGPFLHTLSESTWGLSFTANDHLEGTLAANAAVATSSKRILSATAAKRANAKMNASMHPMTAFTILNELLARMKTDVGGAGKLGGDRSSRGGAVDDAKAKKRSKTPPPSKTTKKITNHAPLHISSLGLTNAHLSKHSIDAIKRILEIHMSPVLHLDLSFAYIGYQGAVMLAEALQHKNCSLATLNICGNAFSEDALLCLAPALRDNRTLTHLDLRSNRICDGTALRAITSSLANGNGVLHSLNLRNNMISERAIYRMKDVLRGCGRDLKILSEYDAPVTAGAASSNTMNHAPHQRVSLIQKLARTVEETPRGVPCVLYSVSMRPVMPVIFPNVDGGEGDAMDVLEVSWDMRAVGDVYSENEEGNSWKPRLPDSKPYKAPHLEKLAHLGAKHGDEDKHYISKVEEITRSAKGWLHWELQLVSGDRHEFLCAGVVDASGVACGPLQEPQWVTCRANVPLSRLRTAGAGAIEVHATVSSHHSFTGKGKPATGSSGGKHKTSAVLTGPMVALEGKRLCIEGSTKAGMITGQQLSVSNDQLRDDRWSNATYSTIANRVTEASSVTAYTPKGYVVLSALKWIETQQKRVPLVSPFQLKLLAERSEHDETDDGDKRMALPSTQTITVSWQSRLSRLGSRTTTLDSKHFPREYDIGDSKSESKGQIDADAKGNDARKSENTYSEGLGYAWGLLKVDIFGRVTHLKKGSFPDQPHSQSPSLLWQWQNHSVPIAGLQSNDTVILYAKPARIDISSTTDESTKAESKGGEDDLSDTFTVSSRGFSFEQSIHGEDAMAAFSAKGLSNSGAVEEAGTPAYLGNINPKAAFLVYNDPGIHLQ
jgi:Ran GTPase-activating protein (RanGAP) involved in mRNA processing and transport